MRLKVTQNVHCHLNISATYLTVSFIKYLFTIKKFYQQKSSQRSQTEIKWLRNSFDDKNLLPAARKPPTHWINILEIVNWYVLGARAKYFLAIFRLAYKNSEASPRELTDDDGKLTYFFRKKNWRRCKSHFLIQCCPTFILTFFWLFLLFKHTFMSEGKGRDFIFGDEEWERGFFKIIHKREYTTHIYKACKAQ